MAGNRDFLSSVAFSFAIFTFLTLSLSLILYVWPELTNRFFKTLKLPQNEVRDGKIYENEGGLHLGV
jgi:hypothetical protein